MTKARTNASASPAVGRNMIINGAMNVAQRSASVAAIGAADGYFTLDRWQINVGATSAGRLTMTQTADGPNGISANCLKLDCTTADASIAAGELLQIMHKMEGQNLQRIGKGVAGAKQVTVSFYVKGNASATYVAELFDADNTRSIGALFSVTTDWTRVVIVFPADVDDGSSPYGDDNALSLSLVFTLHAGSAFTSAALNTVWSNNDTTKRAAGGDSFFDATSRTFFLTGVQMEVGPVATEFEQEDISTTLAKCQRYFQRLEWAGGNMIVTLQQSVSAGMFNLAYTKKRADPSFVIPTATVATNQANGISLLTSAGAYRGSSGSEAVAVDQISSDSCRFNFSSFADSGAIGDATWAYFTTNTSSPELKCFIDIDAEL
jgi:hypothetical protein